MPRQPRIFVPGASCHVIQRGTNCGTVFSCRSDYARFVGDLKSATRRYHVAVHAFTLMTTHVHLLVTPTDRTSLPRAMQGCCGEYVQRGNFTYNRSGTLWNGRYKSIMIKDERQWLTCLRYIERNPVEAGMVDDPGEYEWSSYRTHAFGEGSDWLAPHWVYLALGATCEMRQAVYRALSAGPRSTGNI